MLSVNALVVIFCHVSPESNDLKAVKLSVDSAVYVQCTTYIDPSINRLIVGNAGDVNDPVPPDRDIAEERAAP